MTDTIFALASARGRAGIGGLTFATVSTLFFVPVVFSILHRHYGAKLALESSPGVPHGN